MKREGIYTRGVVKASILVLVLIGFFIYWFLHDFTAQVDNRVREMTGEHLQDIGNQSVKKLTTEMDKLQKAVRTTADYLSVVDSLTEKEEKFLYVKLEEECGFSHIRLISKEGVLYSPDHQRLEESGEAYASQLLAGKSGQTDVFFSEEAGGEIFAFYAPVFKNETVAGGIAGIMTVDELVDLIESTGFHFRSYSYVLGNNGTILIQDNHWNSLYNGRDYFRFLDHETDDSTMSAEELQKRMEKQESGFLRYRVGEEKRIAYFAPADLNSWYVLTMVSEDVTNHYTNEIRRTAMHLTVKVVILFILLVLLMSAWFRKTRRMILESKAETELEKKKLEIALSHTVNTTFEYFVKQDRLVFITDPGKLAKGIPYQISEAASNVVSLGFIDPASLDEFRQMVSQAALGEEPLPQEVLGGKVFEEDSWLRISMTPVKDREGRVMEFVGTVEDITEEKRTQRRFAQEEQYREALLSEAVAMWSVDLIRKQLTACTVMGKNRLEGRERMPYSSYLLNHISEAVHPDDKERIRKFIQVTYLLTAYYTGERELKELFRIKYPGKDSYKWVTCTVSLLSEPVSKNPIAFAYMKDVDEETRREMELTYSSERDPLTGLYNRRNIEKKAEEALKQGLKSCLMMFDMDGFKGINDRFGHQEGDRVLRQMAAILNSLFREEDLVARFGGDEFLVFLSDFKDKAWVYERAEKVRSQVCQMSGEDRRSQISVSIGLAFAPEAGNTFPLLYKRADEALYAAKGGGKNRIMESGS